MNKISQQQQMDIAVRYWCPDENCVKTQYYSTAFLSRTRAVDLLCAFQKEFHGVDLKKLLQVSMDGPTVNLKFLKDLIAELSLTNDGLEGKILFMGTCGLHVLHNAFKTSFLSVGWNTVQFLRSEYCLFKDSPARRLELSNCQVGAEVVLMPLKFFPVRWLGNGKTAQRALQNLPNFSLYVAKANLASHSFKVVSEALNDKLLPAKLAFFVFVSEIFEPFLEKYQSDAPLAPFLFSDLCGVLMRLMSCFVKQDVLEKAQSCTKIDLTKKDNLVSAKNLKIGMGVKVQLRKLTDVSDSDVLAFKEDCKTILKSTCQKILDKSPVKYPLCKAISFCNPEILIKSQGQALSRLEKAPEIFHENRWVTASQCDTITTEFRNLCSKPAALQALKDFDPKVQKLDKFWFDLLVTLQCSPDLVNFMKKVLILSHGNAFVERGFSINREVIVENQLPQSLIAQRRVCDAVQLAGGVNEVEIDKKMILAARNARAFYSESLEKNKKDAKAQEDAVLNKKRWIDMVAELKAKKQKILAESQRKTDEIDEEMNKLRSQFIQ